MKRILHVYKNYFPGAYGGVAEVIRQIAKGCQGTQYSCDIFAFSDNPDHYPSYEFENSTVHIARQQIEIASTPISTEAFSRFQDLSKSSDLIHFHYPFPIADMLHATISQKKPAIMTYHSDIVQQRLLKKIYYPLERWMLTKIDSIICTSPNYLETSQTLLRYRDKTTIIPLGIDDKLTTLVSRDRLQYWRKLTKGQGFLLYVGALRNYKGVDVLLEAARHFSGTIVIAGGGDKLQMYKNLIKKLGLEKVHLTGFIDEIDKATLLSLCDALILPSNKRSEAFGIVQLEAAIFKKPLICTELGTGTTYVNKDGLTGIVVPPNDSRKLYEAMKFLSDNPIRAKEMGNQAYRRYVAKFTDTAMCKAYLNTYDNLLYRVEQ